MFKADQLSGKPSGQVSLRACAVAATVEQPAGSEVQGLRRQNLPQQLETAEPQPPSLAQQLRAISRRMDSRSRKLDSRRQRNNGQQRSAGKQAKAAKMLRKYRAKLAVARENLAAVRMLIRLGVDA